MNKRILEMRNKKAALLKEIRELVEAGEAGEAIEASVQEQIDGLMEQVKAIDSRVAALEELAKAEDNDESADGEEEEARARPAIASVEARSGKRGNKDYRSAFHRFIKDGTTAGIEQRSGDTNSLGAIIPTELDTDIVKRMTDNNVMRQIASVKTVTGFTDMPVFTGSSGAALIKEGADYPEINPQYLAKKFKPYKFGGVSVVTKEALLSTPLDLEAEFMADVPEDLGVAEEKEMLVGDGVEGPEGVFTAARVAINAAADALTAEDLIDLHYSVAGPYRRNGVWLMSDNTLAMVRKLKDGSGAFLWSPALHPGQPETILGRPVYTSTQCPDVGSGQKSVLFGDFQKGYRIGDRTGFYTQRLVEAYAKQGKIGFMIDHFTDGKAALPAAIAAIKHA